MAKFSARQAASDWSILNGGMKMVEGIRGFADSGIFIRNVDH